MRHILYRRLLQAKMYQRIERINLSHEHRKRLMQILDEMGL